MSTFHITNGDCAAEPLRLAVGGRVLCACDPLHEGPAPAGIEGRAWYEARGRYLSGGEAPDESQVRRFAELDETLAAGTTGDEVVLWFEHDLFDQLNLIRTLVQLAGDDGTPRPAVSMVCIDEYLGNLRADRLAALYPSRRQVTADDYRLAVDAWSAFRAPEPSALLALIDTPLGPERPAWHRFLARALRRFLAEYPAVGTGLSRTEEAAIRALADGPLTGRELFPRAQAGEKPRFLGDLILFALLLDLANARVPLVTVDGARQPEDLFTASIALTAAGRDVAAGLADAVALNGIDRWRGGVHLLGTEAAWRWDPLRQTLVSWA